MLSFKANQYIKCDVTYVNTTTKNRKYISVVFKLPVHKMIKLKRD